MANYFRQGTDFAKPGHGEFVLRTTSPPQDTSRHILYLIDTFHRRTGGAERALINITRCLPHDRYRCSVVTFATSADVISIHNEFSCPVHVFPLKRTYDWNSLRVAMQLRDLIRSQEVSIVHTFFETSDLWGGLVAKLSGAPVLISSRRDMGIYRVPKHRVAYRLLRGMFDQVQAVSGAVRAFSIQEDGLDPDRVVTLHNGVDLEEIDAAVPALRANVAAGLERASHLVVTVGNLRSVKGTDILIRAAARVRQEFPDCVFLVIGEASDPDYFRELQELANSAQVADNIRFLGLRNDTLSLLKMCDIFILPSRSEGMSNALLEAMACRLPAIATHVGGNGELVQEEQSGFLVPADDPNAIAERLLTLLRDRQLAGGMGDTARRIIEAGFTVQVVTQRLVEYYDRLLQAKLAKA